MGYCEPSDLLIGDIAGLEPMKQQFIDSATEDMDAMIGYVYELPLSGLATHAELVLKGICRKLASGRLLMAQAAGSEDTSVHAYGQSLVDEAMRDLWAIRNGQTELFGGIKTTTNLSSGNGPAIIQGDTYSAVDAFYGWVSQPLPVPVLQQNPIWAPGIHD